MASLIALGGFPVPVQVLDRQTPQGSPVRAGLLLHNAKTRLEPPRRAAQGVLWIDAELAGDVDHREKEVAELGLPRLGRNRLPQFIELLAHLIERPLDVGP